MTKFTKKQDADPKLVRIYNILKKRRGLSEKDFAKMFMIKSFKNSSAFWRYIQIIINVMEEIETARDLYKHCPHCGDVNPFDREELEQMTAKEEHEYEYLCESCNKPLF